MPLVPKPRPDADTIARLKAIPQLPPGATLVVRKAKPEDVVASLKSRYGEIKPKDF